LLHAPAHADQPPPKPPLHWTVATADHQPRHAAHVLPRVLRRQSELQARRTEPQRGVATSQSVTVAVTDSFRFIFIVRAQESEPIPDTLLLLLLLFRWSACDLVLQQVLPRLVERGP